MSLAEAVKCIHEQTDPSGVLYIGIGDAGNRSAVPYGIGQLNNELHDSVPRVVWVPTSGSMGAPSNIGGRIVGNTRDRSLLTRVQNCTVHCWGYNFAQAERIWLNMLAATWAYAHGSVQFGSHTWQTQAEGEADYAMLGQLVTQQVSLEMPVLESAISGLPLTDITSQTHVGIIELTSGDEIVC